MPLRATVVVAAAAAVIGMTGPGTANAATGWQEQDLPIPAGYEGAYFTVSTTDGKGNVTGSVFIAEGDTESDLVLWSGGHATVVRNPLQCNDIRPADQNPTGTVAVNATSCAYDPDQVFTYDSGGYHRLDAPSLYRSSSAVAINPSGVVLGRARASDLGDPDVTVLWRPGVEEPQLVPDTLPGQRPVDLDDDGTILFQTDDGPAIWRDGTMTKLTTPAGFASSNGYAIKHGVVVGGAAVDTDHHSAYWWPSPTTPKALPGATQASDINASGLVVGDLMTWRGGQSAGALPDGYGGGGSASAAGDDGTVVGNLQPDYRTTIPVVWVSASRR